MPVNSRLQGGAKGAEVESNIHAMSEAGPVSPAFGARISPNLPATKSLLEKAEERIA
jgi:hypothetical protein